MLYLLATFKEMFWIGVWRDRMWPDGWTAVTADGKRSAQFEHTLLVHMRFFTSFIIVFYFYLAVVMVILFLFLYKNIIQKN